MELSFIYGIIKIKKYYPRIYRKVRFHLEAGICQYKTTSRDFVILVADTQTRRLKS